KIHYQIYDSLGRIVQVLVDNDGKSTTGVSRTDNEGAPVAGIDQVLAYSYNVKGEVTEMKRDNNVDGKYDYREAYTLNANGNWIAKQVDLTNDGQFDRKEVYTKSASDAYLKTEFYNIVDGRDVATRIEHYENNANNQRTAVKVDTLGDGSTDSITRYDLDALGRVAKAYFDTNGDNQVDRAEIYTRDSHGRTVKTEYDEGNNGSIDSNRTYTHNANGYHLTVSTDSDNNGTIDITTTYTRDEYGRAVGTIVATSTGSTTYVDKYDAAGNKIYSSTDNRSDGTINTEYTWTYDEYGNALTRTEINAETGAIKNIRTYLEYDTNNRVIKESYDDKGDGLSANDVLIEYGRDTTWGAVIYQKETYLESGKINFIANSDLNSVGAQIRTYTDEGGDGVINRLNYGSHIAGGYYDFIDDLTSWDNEQLAKLTGLEIIRLSRDTARTEITLDAETVAKLAPSNNLLRIWGDATDTVNLEGFTQSGANRAGTTTYYKATVEGVEYTLHIDSTIDTVLG
ncbi:hypothetical protein, partial [Mannheimia indoligenes]|uniref:hypothetical protein n=1 Tax=Mannheimia indoligenes TaxID=3103145 RepID=UPI002FE5FB41